MADRVARLSALRRNRNAKISGSGLAEDDRLEQVADQSRNPVHDKSLSSEPLEIKEVESSNQNEVEQNVERETQDIPDAKGASYNSDLKRDIQDLLDKSERATDIALKKIIRERFQELQQNGE